ncbi:Kinesin-like protein KIF19 [Nymphon striatum]|nr:Kinesin-like protein KIF19 [Nymphon striatum]
MTDLPSPSSPGPKSPDSNPNSTKNESETPAEKSKIDILLKATGDAPIMKKKKWAVEPSKTICSIILFVKKYLKLDESESLFIYVNQAFAPSPDEEVRNLFEDKSKEDSKKKDVSKTQKVPLAEQKVLERQQKEKERQERKIPLDSKIKAEKSRVPNNDLGFARSNSPPMETTPRSESKDGDSQLTVVLRVRPISSSEQQRGFSEVVKRVDNKMVVLMDPQANKSDILRAKRSNEKQFVFDCTFDGTATQEEVYTKTTKKLIDNVLNGYNGTVFAYGATGAGKTHTMVGNDSDPGTMVRALNDLFSYMENTKEQTKYSVSMSYCEIYNEMIRDLLNPSTGYLELRENAHGAHKIAGLSEMPIRNPNEVMALLTKGNKQRTQEPTAANKTSSRSHAMLQVTIRKENRIRDINTEVRTGQLYMVDLAGSERAAQTQNSGKRLKEGAHINRSLLALGNCINALGKRQMMELDNTMLALSTEFDKLTIIIDQLEVEKAQRNITSSSSEYPKDSKEKKKKSKEKKNKDKKNKNLNNSSEEDMDIKAAWDEIHYIQSEQSKYLLVREEVQLQFVSAQDEIYKLEEDLPKLISNSDQREIMELLCKVHELEIQILTDSESTKHAEKRDELLILYNKYQQELEDMNTDTETPTNKRASSVMSFKSSRQDLRNGGKKLSRRESLEKLPILPLDNDRSTNRLRSDSIISVRSQLGGSLPTTPLTNTERTNINRLPPIGKAVNGISTPTNKNDINGSVRNISALASNKKEKSRKSKKVSNECGTFFLPPQTKKVVSL